MSGLFRARLPLSDGEWSDVLTVAEVSLDASPTAGSVHVLSRG